MIKNVYSIAQKKTGVCVLSVLDSWFGFVFENIESMLGYRCEIQNEPFIFLHAKFILVLYYNMSNRKNIKVTHYNIK